MDRTVLVVKLILLVQFQARTDFLVVVFGTKLLETAGQRIATAPPLIFVAVVGFRLIWTNPNP